MTRKAVARITPDLGDVLRTLLRTPGVVPILALSLLLGLAYSFVLPFMSLFGTREVGMSTFEFGLFMTTTSLTRSCSRPGSLGGRTRS